MWIDESPSPLTVAAQLLSAHGEDAAYEAMQRSIDHHKMGEHQVSEFWLAVTSEVLDALTSG